MAQIQDNTHKTKPRNSRFLGCFRFSGKVPEKKPLNTYKPCGRKKNRWFAWSRFRMKKSDAKTVPVDADVPEKASRSKKNHAEKKITSKHHIPASQIPATLPGQSVYVKPHKEIHESAQNIILEVHQNLDDVDSIKDDTCPERLSLCRKIEARKTGGSHPGSPEQRSNPCRTTAIILSPSASSPPPKHKKPAAAGRNSGGYGGKIDPVVGMSIIIVTLVIMLLWGRLCAILCSSAWFYFVPRLRRVGTKPSVSMENEYGSNQIEDPDLNYEEYKKKVVIEGFLERKHRNA